MLDEARARAAGCRAVGAVGVGAFDRSVTKPHINQGKQIMPTPLILAPSSVFSDLPTGMLLEKLA